MKISKNKIGIIFILAILVTVQTVSFATYQSVIASEKEQKENIDNIILLNQDVVLNEEEQEVLDLINKYRCMNGLEALKPLSNLQYVAKMKAEDLVCNNYFAHESKILGTPFEMLKSNGIDYFSIEGENLAGASDGKRAVELWINSTGHRENILESRFEYTGIYVINSPLYGKIFVQIFIGTKKGM